MVLFLAACSAAHPGGATKVGVSWELQDATCTGDDCPGGTRVDVTLVVTQRGTSVPHKLGQLTADADDGPTGAQRCQVAVDEVSCSGTPEQNVYSLAVEGRELRILSKYWIDGGDGENDPPSVVETVPLVGSPPFQLVLQSPRK
jgi:hypothetical protein